MCNKEGRIKSVPNFSRLGFDDRFPGIGWLVQSSSDRLV